MVWAVGLEPTVSGFQGRRSSPTELHPGTRRGARTRRAPLRSRNAGPVGVGEKLARTTRIELATVQIDNLVPSPAGSVRELVGAEGVEPVIDWLRASYSAVELRSRELVPPVAAAKADGTFFIASPFHCAVGTKPA